MALRWDPDPQEPLPVDLLESTCLSPARCGGGGRASLSFPPAWRLAPRTPAGATRWATRSRLATSCVCLGSGAGEEKLNDERGRGGAWMCAEWSEWGIRPDSSARGRRARGQESAARKPHKDCLVPRRICPKRREGRLAAAALRGQLSCRSLGRTEHKGVYASHPKHYKFCGARRGVVQNPNRILFRPRSRRHLAPC